MFPVFMRRKCIHFIIILVMLFQAFTPSFLFAASSKTSDKQPEVCSGPSKMMDQYFEFQREVKTALLWEFNEKLMYTDVWQGRLFTKWVLKLPSAIDFLASNIWWNAKSILSNSVTSTVILLLASVSVLQSNTEWFAILFKDRPIVREYKSMLDIETELFDTAYFQSKSINLTLNLDWKIYEDINKIIEKYQNSWLFEKNWPKKLNGNESMADILMELISINTSMKHFILFLWKPKTNSLDNYYWCFWSLNKNLCNRDNAILIFSQDAINQLKNDYSHLSMFGTCNLYASNFKNTMRKLNNVTDPIDSAQDEIKEARKRLKTALLWQKDSTNTKKNRCDIDDYEMAQLKAYRWSNWTCQSNWVDASLQYPKINEYFQNKKVQNEQRKQSTNLIQQSATPQTSQQILFDMHKEIKNEFDSLIIEYEQSQNNAISSDLSFELKQIKWLLDQVDASITNAESLKWNLEKITNYQCAW